MAESHFPTASVIFQPQSELQAAGPPEKWVFGGDIPTAQLNLGHTQNEIADRQQSEMHRETKSVTAEGTDMEQIVSTTTRRRPRKHDAQLDGSTTGGDEEDFFEDDLDVVEFATDRV